MTDLLTPLPEDALREWFVTQRWFGSKASEVAHLNVLEAFTLREQAPQLLLALIEARFPQGTHEVYQVPVGIRPASEGWSDRVIAEAEGNTYYDALADPAHARELLHLMRAGADVQAGEGMLAFRWSGGAGEGGTVEVRPVGVEQSNSSIVFGEQLILKTFRRVEPGVNPELELLRFLSERDFPHIAPIAGWFQYDGRLMDATLGVLQEFLAGAQEGWEFALDSLASDPEAFLGQLHALGTVTGELHTALGSDANDPAFAPEEPSGEAISILTATIDEEIERIWVELPDDPAIEPIRGRGQDVQEHLQALASVGTAGRVIRTHGDYHLGQTMLADRGWVILDFEGEPARPMSQRRLKRSPLRDVAGMLRSFSYVAAASGIQRGAPPPEGWEERARETFLDGYFDTVEQGLLPPGDEATRKMLSIFELEKAVYELRYELNNRPDWVAIPVAGIVRLLESNGGS
jgi:maltokinase